MPPTKEFDVAIIGGGPSGATAGGFLKKYKPDLKVGIYEREEFPRDHIGESQLPPIGRILDELGCWDKVEAANFPIKIGGTYRWGRSPELWYLEFVPFEEFKQEDRPGKLQGQRLRTAFQVDRSIYDKILLDHAAELGCEVHEGAKVLKVGREDDRITELQLEDGSRVTARHYIDASGTSAILRRAMGVDCDYPSSLQNIAIWEYWQNTEWAVKIGVGGTRILILSLPYGWLWFIPLGPTRTSIGLVIPAAFFKASGKKPAELYRQALAEETMVAELTKHATSEGKLFTTKDWSFLAQRHSGQNWFLAGEAAGFADPILSAGMTMAHMAGREVAFTILEMDRGKLDPEWLKEEFGRRQSARVVTHIRFADYWYTANTQFKELKEFTTELAKNAGLHLDPARAWEWIGQGGFIDEDATVGTGGFSLALVKALGAFLSELDAGSPLLETNIYQLDLRGAKLQDRAGYRLGAVEKGQCYVRGDRVLPLVDAIQFAVNLLQFEKTSSGLVRRIRETLDRRPNDGALRPLVDVFPQVLEALILDGWVKATRDRSRPPFVSQEGCRELRWEHEIAPNP